MGNNNYNPILEQMKETMKICSKRNLSLAERIYILKSQILSKLNYCMTLLASPKEEYWKHVNRMLGQFTANSKTEKIKRTCLIGDDKDGGFRLPDITTQNISTKITWLKRLINNVGMWREYILEQIPKVNY